MAKNTVTTPNWNTDSYENNLSIGQENQFGSTRGLRYGPLRINKTGIFVNNGTLDSTIINNTGFHGYGLSGIEQITLDASTGVNITDGTNSIFKAEISGTNVGDVTMGAYSGGAGVFYDKSAGTFTIKGTISASSFSGGTIEIGSGNNVFKADSNGIYLGNATFASAPFRVTMAGALIASSATISGTISSGSGSSYTGNAIAESYIGNLSASKITSGTIYVGGGGEPAAIYIRQGTISDTAKIRWDGGSRMWEDTSNRLGINSIGSPMYIYVNSNEKLVIPSSGQLTLRGGAYCDGNVNITGDMRCNKITMNQSADEANIEDVNIIKGYNDINFQLGSNSYYFSFYNTSYDEKAHIDSSGNIQKDGTVSFDIIHPEIPNYRLRYPAVEAPEVALQIRGIAKLKKGVAVITTPHHWELVTEKNGLLSASLTPLEDCNGLYTPKNKMSNTSFEVRELLNGNSNIEFTYEYTVVRKGYLNFNPEYPMTPQQIEKMNKMSELRKLKIKSL